MSESYSNLLGRAGFRFEVGSTSNHPALAAFGLFLAILWLAACQPTVKVDTEEPITINLNIKLDAEVKLKLEEQAEDDIEENPDIF